MYNSLSYKSKQFFWLFTKLSIVFGCGFFIYNKLKHNNQLNFSDFYQNLTQNNVFSIQNSLFLLFMSFLNWFLEIRKWQTLVSFLRKINFKSAAKQSLAALTTSLITPNRIGEYGAKSVYFYKNERKKILNLNLIGNLHQLFATVFFGFLGLLYLVTTKNINLKIKNYYYIIIFFIVITVLFLVFKNLISNKNIFKNYSIKITLNQHIKISVFSFLRYLIFSHQFYFLLVIFKIDISYITAISAISSMYVISSFIPMLSLFDVILKGTVAIFIFNFFNVNSITILSITTIMWILNFVIPAIIGSYFVLTFKPKLTT